MDLDKRQRAMLREMGVRLWQPPSPPPVAADAAINTVAVDAPPKRAEGRFDVEAEPARALAPAAAPAVRPPAQVPVARPATGLQPRPAGVELMDWPALQAAVAGCRACALCESRKNTVFGIGPVAADGAAPQVDWLIVGEAPGENEDLAGEPFVGQAGKLLDNMLLAIGLQRGHDAAAPRAGLSTSVFITNVLKCRPPANRNPDPAEVAQCEPYLKRQVELLQPKMILALGKFAAQSLLQDSVPEVQKIPLGKLRGQVFRYLGVPVVVSYHPAYLLRSLGDKAKAWDDLCLAQAQL
ncbi:MULTISPECIES: uracil-DNA glycosylase [unclassified Polaromonas]|uniref:uracil-DNA glycosylase n=1 Tax=unclassified Polaromonas TaxID=2638319 RepID=UPI0025E295CB|nr:MULTISPECIES: uracil-DNA glycosylase [unclassified Polaromonas]HQR97312.1 uracil-DNA glycosylase [Polaromonas sp.]HQS39643.1 uracil-DNA glycosylase [Polaromonas sp.]HQS87141.1 uracil-DNA glycosylase [Polaromonas sp.]HQT09073.1 uracil-DNA glycosylase [Polaromonas sp.]